ncbi:YbjN domain-containing protein [Stratiformator vulcanicus]|uniref:Circadian clock protein KaiB n=1 Tax=Stratiformator vulcanicus TaxID=2527980 RepID=A0A517R1S7_9PLAN|nr:YbjN domain-containing protein [Stratiformator vulcanicus]QDT37811.1 hypothetical protein Pan189_21930 [Stratiformator vulcanicus]
MTLLYREKNSDPADRIEEELRELALRFEVRIAGRDTLPEGLREIERLPILLDEGETFSTPQQIRSRLDHLAALMADWNRKHQSDSCYVDENGEVC